MHVHHSMIKKMVFSMLVDGIHLFDLVISSSKKQLVQLCIG
jgi:hypothetical protein